MKRSHPFDEDDRPSMVESKKSKNEPVLPNDNYYLIRKARPTTSASLSSLDSPKSEGKFKGANRRSTADRWPASFDKRDRFVPFDKKDRIHEKKGRLSFEKPSEKASSFEKSSLQSKSTSSLNQSESFTSSQTGYTIKLPANYRPNEVGPQFGSDIRGIQTSSSYVMRSAGEKGKQTFSAIV